MRLERVLVGLLAVSAFEIPLQSLPNETTAALDNKQHTWYSGILYVGTPPRPFTFTFLTESQWTWLTDVSCGADCHEGSPFNRSKSTSFESTSERVPHSGLVGDLAYEAMSFNVNEVQVRKQPFLLMNNTKRLEDSLRTDGEW